MAARRSVPHLLVGAGLVIACAVVFALVALRAQKAEPVLALARAVPAGQALSAADLTTVQVHAEDRAGLLAATRRAGVVGRTLRVPLPAGQLLSGQLLGASDWPPAGQAVVAVPVTAGHLPAGVQAGAAVDVVASSSTGQPSTSGSAASGSPVVMRATVVQVEAADASGASVVSVLMTSADAVRVAASGGGVSLVLQGAGT